MEATELIELIRTSEKKTPVRVVLQANAPCEFPGAEVFSGGKVKTASSLRARVMAT